LAAELVFTAGVLEQLRTAFSGRFLKGRAEPRVAMVGRSNVGKSSLINAITKSRVAQTSSTPGKTRLIHCYHWAEEKKILVDLPGYGFARAGAEEKQKWSDLITAYLRADEGLQRAVVLLDARNGPSELDAEALRFLAAEQVPVTVVFTKSDGLKNQSERARRLRDTSEALRSLGYDPSLAIWVSAHDRKGLNELIRELRSSAAPIAWKKDE
jgi:GTP-binding protein